ncbi:MAG TPA: hypothetical protein VIN03_12640 [Roseateles sp.]
MAASKVLSACVAGAFGCASATTPATYQETLCAPDAYLLATVIEATGGGDCVPRPPRRCYLTSVTAKLKVLEVVAVHSASERGFVPPKVDDVLSGNARLSLLDPQLAEHYRYRPVEDAEVNQVFLGSVHLVGVYGLNRPYMQDIVVAAYGLPAGAQAIDFLTEELRQTGWSRCAQPVLPLPRSSRSRK